MAVPRTLRLSRTTTSYIVRPVFYGGPLDGAIELPVKTDELLGKIRAKAGSYEMVGFTCSVQDDDPMKEFSMDLAVYQWA